MGSKSSDKVDYRGAALAEGEMSRDNLEAQTHANRIDQYNPWGKVDYTPTQGFDTNGKPITHWRQDTTLAAPLDRALSEQMNMQMNRSRVANAMTSNLLNEQKWQNTLGAEDFDPMMDYVKNGPFDDSGIANRIYGGASEVAGAEDMQRQLNFSGAPQLGGQNMMQNINMAGIPEAQRQAMQDSTGFQDPGLGGQNLQTDLDYSGASQVGESGDIRNKAEDAIYDRGSQRLDRRMEQATSDMEIKLRGQGLQPGDESYDRAMTDLNNQKTDAYQALSNEAIMGGGQEATRDFGMQMDRRGMMTGETDKQGEYRNAALSGQFGIDAQRQAQMQQVAQAESGFGNDARSQQYQQDQDRRQSQFGMNQQQGQFTNQAKQSQFDIDNARRQASIGETGMMGDYANQASAQQYAMNQEGARDRTQNERDRVDSSNEQRDQAINERLITGQENRARNREWVDQQNMQRQQAINEAAQFRSQGMNEVTAWMQGQQVQQPTFQQYNTAGVAQTPQLLQAAGMRGQENAAMDSADNAMMNSLMGGLGSGAGMMMSDRRLKKNIKRIGTKQGHAWYSFRYIWGVEGEGVMADEIPAEFRVRMGDHDMVNYGELFA